MQGSYYVNFLQKLHIVTGVPLCLKLAVRLMLHIKRTALIGARISVYVSSVLNLRSPSDIRIFADKLTVN